MVATIELPNSAEPVLVDDFLHEWLSLWKWSVNNNGYVYRTFSVQHKTCTVLMHRAIFQLPSEIGEIDHADGNKLNNQMANLRLATRSQNMRNRGPGGSTSPYKGVCWHKGKKRWIAAIRVNGRTCNLGRYTDEVLAAHVYDAAARFYSGEYAWTNFEGATKLSVEEIRLSKKQGQLLTLITK